MKFLRGAVALSVLSTASGLPLVSQSFLMLARAEAPALTASWPANTGGSSAAATTKAPLPPPTWQTKFNRWADFNDISFSFRYRNQFANTGFHYFDNGQQRSLVDGRFKFDPAGRYTIHAHVSSGQTFNWAYSDEINADIATRNVLAHPYFTRAQLIQIYYSAAADPAGYAEALAIPSRGWGMHFRQLFFNATPVQQLSFEFGSLGITKGEGTEATTYDDDGYIVGERIRLLDPAHLYFDQLAVTYAYEGDIYKPSFFDRGQRLGQSNYHQFLAAKHFGKRIGASTDYTFDKGTHTVREAAFVKVPEVKAIDSVRVELYQRLNDHVLSGKTYFAHQGLAVTASKNFYQHFKLDGGYAHIDQDYGVLTGDRVLATVGFSMNGDAYLTGTRAFTRATWNVRPGLSFSGHYTHTLTDSPAALVNLGKQGFTGGIILDFSKVLFPGTVTK